MALPQRRPDPPTEPRVVTWTCPDCGYASRWRGQLDERGGWNISPLVEMTPLGPEPASSFVCEHWQDVHMAVFDLLEGLDPHERCRDCGCNPCHGGGDFCTAAPCECPPGDPDCPWDDF